MSLHPPRVSLVVKGIAVEDHALVDGDGFLQSSLGVATPSAFRTTAAIRAGSSLDSISVLTSTEWHLEVMVPAKTDPSLVQWALTRHRISPNFAFNGYRSLLDSRILPAFGRSPLGLIDRPTVTDWIRSMVDEGLSPSRIRQAHQCISAILEQAVDEGAIGRNPARKVELPQAIRARPSLSHAEQVSRLAGSMPNRQAHAIVYLLAYDGLRWGELVATRRGRVDILGRRLLITESAGEISGRLTFGPPKSDLRRTIHVPGFVADMVACGNSTATG